LQRARHHALFFLNVYYPVKVPQVDYLVDFFQLVGDWVRHHFIQILLISLPELLFPRQYFQPVSHIIPKFPLHISHRLFRSSKHPLFPAFKIRVFHFWVFFQVLNDIVQQRKHDLIFAPACRRAENRNLQKVHDFRVAAHAVPSLIHHLDAFNCIPHLRAISILKQDGLKLSGIPNVECFVEFFIDAVVYLDQPLAVQLFSEAIQVFFHFEVSSAGLIESVQQFLPILFRRQMEHPRDGILHVRTGF